MSEVGAVDERRRGEGSGSVLELAMVIAFITAPVLASASKPPPAPREMPATALSLRVGEHSLRGGDDELDKEDAWNGFREQ